MFRIKLALILLIIFYVSIVYAAELQFTELQTIKAHHAPIVSVDISSDGYIATASFYNNNIKIWNQENEKFVEVQSIDCWLTNYPTCVKFTPDGQLLASGQSNGNILIWDKENNWGSNEKYDSCIDTTYQYISAQPKTNIRDLKYMPIWCICFSPDGKFLVAGGSEKTLKIWKKIDNKFVEFQKISYCHLDDIKAIDFNSNGIYLASGGDDGIINIWKKENDEFIKFQTIKTESPEIRSLSFSPDDKYLVAGGSEGKLICWKVENNNFVKTQTIKEHSDKINSISFELNSNYLAVASSDNTLTIWKLKNDKFTLQNKLSRHKDKITSVTFSQDGNYLTSVDLDGLINIWKLENDEISLYQEIDDNLFKINSLTFHPNSELLASAGEDNYIKIWKIEKSKMQSFQNLKLINNPIKQLSFSPDGKYLFSLGEYKGFIEVWEKEGNKYKKSDIFKDDVGNNGCFSFSKKNNYFALGYWNGVEIYNYTKGNFNKIHNLTYEVNDDNFDKLVKDISFSPNGKYLAVGHLDKTISLWDCNNREYDSEIIIKDSISCTIDKIEFSSKGNYLFVELDGIGKTLKIYKKSKNKFFEFQTIRFGVFALNSNISISPNEDYFCLGYLHNSILYKRDGSEFKLKIEESIKSDSSYYDISNCIINVNFSPDGEYLACTIDNGVLKFFKINGLRIPFDQYIKIKLASFLEKDEFETTEEYKNRTQKYKNMKIQEIIDDALLKGYKFKITDISAYNADKEEFIVDILYFNSVNILVPRDYARNFKENLNKLEIKNPQLKLKNNALVITYVEIYNPINNNTFGIK